MFDREFITVPRILDDAPIHLRIKDIQMICVNANESGPVEGTSAIYLRDSLAVAANMDIDDVVELIRAAEVLQ